MWATWINYIICLIFDLLLLSTMSYASFTRWNPYYYTQSKNHFFSLITTYEALTSHFSLLSSPWLLPKLSSTKLPSIIFILHSWANWLYFQHLKSVPRFSREYFHVSSSDHYYFPLSMHHASLYETILVLFPWLEWSTSSCYLLKDMPSTSSVSPSLPRDYLTPIVMLIWAILNLL